MKQEGIDLISKVQNKLYNPDSNVIVQYSLSDPKYCMVLGLAKKKDVDKLNAQNN